MKKIFALSFSLMTLRPFLAALFLWWPEKKIGLNRQQNLHEGEFQSELTLIWTLVFLLLTLQLSCTSLVLLFTFCPLLVTFLSTCENCALFSQKYSKNWRPILLSNSNWHTHLTQVGSFWHLEVQMRIYFCYFFWTLNEVKQLCCSVVIVERPNGIL